MSTETKGELGHSRVATKLTTKITFTPTLDTDAYADGDLLFAANQLSNVFRQKGDSARLVSLVVTDLEKQSLPFDLIFLNANPTNTTQTLNAAADLHDTDLLTVAGTVKVVAADFSAFNDSSAACKRGLNLLMHGASDSKDLWVLGVARDAPTHTASGLQITLEFEQD